MRCTRSSHAFTPSRTRASTGPAPVCHNRRGSRRTWPRLRPRWPCLLLRVRLDAAGDFFNTIHRSLFPSVGRGWGLLQAVKHQEGCQQAEDGVELDRDAEDHALGPVIGLLGQDVQGRGSDLALRDGGDQTAERDRQAGCEVLQACATVSGAAALAAKIWL